MSPSWPLIGRDEELDLVGAVLADSTSAGLVISGHAGVGKTRLARAALDVAARRGHATEWAAASVALASIPFGAVAHLVPDQYMEAGSNRLELVRRTTAAVRRDSTDLPLVLAVDDAHLMDDGSAALVHHLVVADAARVVLTTRAGEPTSETVATLWKDGYLERLELQSLGPRDVEALLVDVLGGPVDERTKERFWDLSHGNVLFLRELVVAARDSRSLERCDGAWHWHGAFQPTVRLRELIQARIERRADVLHVLEHIAVGEPLPLDVAVACCGSDEVAAAESTGLITIQPEDGVLIARCAHPLYHEVARADLGEIRLRSITGTLAVQMVPYCKRPSDRLRIASWHLASGEVGDVSAMADAAATANALFDYGLGEQLARRALEGGGGFRAALALGTALVHLGRSDEGEAVLAALADTATTDQDIVDVAVARYLGATSRGNHPEFGSVLLEAEQRVADPALRAFLRAQRATLLAFAGDFDASLALASAKDPSADHTSLELASIRAVPALGVASILTGHTDRAVEVAEQMLEPALRRVEEMPQALFWVLTTLVNGLTFGGHLAEADAIVTFARDTLAKERVAAETATYFSFATGNIELMRGRVSVARTLLADVVFRTPTEVTSRPPGLALAGAFLVEACALLGDGEMAEAASHIATRTIADVGAFEGGLRRSRAWLAVARGQFIEAADIAMEAAEWARAHGQTTAELHSLHDAVRLGRARVVLERLSGVASMTEGLWAPRFLAHARARADDDGAALDAVASSFEEMDAWLLAAEAATEAAASHQRAALDARAERSRARAQTLLARCECTRVQTIPELGTASALSPREREVALLAARGLTSPEIGDRLSLSRRTVEGHLQHAYAKLGISDRSALAKALGA